jgi:hypothetical protein
MSELYFMDIPATNVATNYPSDGIGGITTTAADTVTKSLKDEAIRSFRILGLEPLAGSAATTNVVTITTAAGATTTVTLPASAVANGYYPLPEYAGKSPGIEVDDTRLLALSDRTWKWPSNIDEGMPVGKSFTVAQANAAWTAALRVWFTADESIGSSVVLYS